MFAPNQSIVTTELDFRLESSQKITHPAAAAETAGGALPNVPWRYHFKKFGDDQTAQLYADSRSL